MDKKLSSRIDDLLVKKNHSIVLLDDNISLIQACIIPIKKSFPLFKIKTFISTNDEFHEYIEKNSIDLFILDVNINGRSDGLKISEILVNMKENPLFLFMSGYNYNLESFASLKGKCIYDFMSKPFSINNLIASIVSLLNIATTYKLLREKQEGFTEIRNYYSNLIARDKLMIENLKIDMEKVISKDPILDKKKIV